MKDDEYTIVNPWAEVSIEEDTGIKLSVISDKADIGLMRSMLPERGMLQSVVNLLLHSIVEEFKTTLNEPYYTPENAKNLKRIILERSRRTVA